jgi:hypothetical protein
MRDHVFDRGPHPGRRPAVPDLLPQGPSLLRPCGSCGTVAWLYHYGLSPGCALPGQVRGMLAPPGQTMRAELEPVAAVLTRGDPALTLKWLESQAARRLLAALAAGTGQVTHDALDQLGPAKGTAYLRARPCGRGNTAPARRAPGRLRALAAGRAQGCRRRRGPPDHPQLRHLGTAPPPARTVVAPPVEPRPAEGGPLRCPGGHQAGGLAALPQAQPRHLPAGRHRPVAHLTRTRSAPCPQLPHLVHVTPLRPQRRDPCRQAAAGQGSDPARRRPPLEHRQGPAARPRTRHRRPRRRLPGAPLRPAADQDRRPHPRPRQRNPRRAVPQPRQRPHRHARAARRASQAGRSARSASASASPVWASPLALAGPQRS